MEPVEEARRDDAWLEERARLLWEFHFKDVPKGYPIVVRFGIRARNRFGSIAARDGKTIILINRLFAHPSAPDFVTDATLAHELAHYAHGFGSGLPRLHAHAHRGGVVDKELERRGLGELTRKAERWREANWDAFYASQCDDLTQRRGAKTETDSERWNRFLLRPECRTEEELRERLRSVAVLLDIAPGTPLFAVEWLRATPRQAGLSYWFARSRAVRLHGLLADPRVPVAVVNFHLAYWAARTARGQKGAFVALSEAGLNKMMEETVRWERRSWTAFRKRNHPLAR